jgi:hypothetical protein
MQVVFIACLARSVVVFNDLSEFGTISSNEWSSDGVECVTFCVGFEDLMLRNKPYATRLSGNTRGDIEFIVIVSFGCRRRLSFSWTSLDLPGDYYE